MAHCARGLEMASLIADRAERERHELGLQVRLGNAATSARGFSAAEVGNALSPGARALRSPRRRSPLHPILVGLYYFHANRAELRDAEKLGLELLALGEERNDRVLKVDAHKVLLNARYKLAKFAQARAAPRKRDEALR